MKHIKQVDSYGCVVACGAMLTGKTYAEVRHDLREVLHGSVSDDTVLPYLYHEGFFARKLTRFNLITQDVVEWPPKPFAPVHWCNVLTSLDNNVGHAVLMDKDGVIYDPLLEGPTHNGFADYVKVYWVAGLWKANLASMKNEPIKVQELKQFAADNNLFGTSYSDLARMVYAERLREKVASARRDSRMIYAFAELVEVVEFLIDSYEKG